MRNLQFFATRIFSKRWILVLVMIVLLFIANYLSFTVVRTMISTFQGYEELETMNQEGTFIFNLDPNSDADFNKIEIDDTQKVYEYINNNYTYALQVGGFITSLHNKNNMDVSFNYLNENSYKLNQFTLSEGKELNFDYEFNKDEIPVLVGAGLATTYPIGSNIEVTDPVTQQLVNLKVQGILEKNISRSNFYSPNLKNYFNFSVFLPVNEEFIQSSGLDFQVNSLMDIALLDSTKENATNLSAFIQENLGLKFNFFSQKENFNDFEEYNGSLIKVICIIICILLVAIVCLAIWNTFTSVRFMIKDRIINLFDGLSYSKLRAILYSYFGILFSLNLVILFGIIAFKKYSFWLNKDATLATYGIFGLISVDWIALLIVLLINLIIGFVIVEITMKKIRKLPITSGEQSE